MTEVIKPFYKTEIPNNLSPAENEEIRQGHLRQESAKEKAAVLARLRAEANGAVQATCPVNPDTELPEHVANSFYGSNID